MNRYDPRADDGRDTHAADREWGGRTGRDADHPRGGNDRGPFTRHLELPGGDERERVRSSGRDYDLDGADIDSLATIGAFRVVQVEDLQDGWRRAAQVRQRASAFTGCRRRVCWSGSPWMAESGTS